MLVLPSGLGRRTVDLTEVQVQVLIEIEPILRAAQLHLVCPRCLSAGRTTEALVGAENGPQDPVWKVSCPCTTRTYRRGQDH